VLLAGRVENREPGIPVTSPHSGETIGHVSRDSAADVARAVAALASSERRLAPADRSRILRRAAELVGGREAELARLITGEAGLCLRDSHSEVRRARANLEVAAEESTRVHGESLEVAIAGRPSLAVWVREPVGLMAAITPFNRPLNQVVVKVAPAIAAGNRVIVKPSEKAPLSALELAGILFEAGLPEDALAVVTGPPEEVGPVLVGSPEVDMVTFTGSVETGRRITRQAGVKKLLLELGGNDPLIVLADADLEQAAEVAVTGAFGSAGQSCRAIKRIVVMEAVADPFVELLRRRAARVRAGDPFEPETEVGPLIDELAAEDAEQRCLRAVEDGAELLVGGHRRGTLFAPTVLDRVSPRTPLVTRETFAPVAPVLRVGTLDEAIEVCNGTRYGLQAGVMTRDFEAFAAIARRLRVGGVALGLGPGFDSPLIPFGGVKASGFGREGMRHAIEEMTVVKTLAVPWGAR
jgi:putative phosphonoacetaldehyde dehydrogenase